MKDGFSLSYSRQKAAALKKALYGVVPTLHKEHLKVDKKNGSEFSSMAKALAPVKTGQLRASIQWKILADNSGVKIYTNDWKAFLVNFGGPAHINKGKFEGTHNPGMPASHFWSVPRRIMKVRAKRRYTTASSKVYKKVFGPLK